MLRRFVPRLLDDDHSDVRLAAAASCCACLARVIAPRLASQSVAWPGLTSSQRDSGHSGGSGKEGYLATQQQQQGAKGSRGSQLANAAASKLSTSSTSGTAAGGGGRLRKASSLGGITEEPTSSRKNSVSKSPHTSKAALKATAACAELFTAAVALLDRVVVVRENAPKCMGHVHWTLGVTFIHARARVCMSWHLHFFYALACWLPEESV